MSKCNYIITSLLLALTINAFAEHKAIDQHEIAHEWMRKRANTELKDYVDLGITQEMLDSTWRDCLIHNQKRTHEFFQRFRVVNSVVYGPDGRMKNLLYAIINKYSLPDIDFIWLQFDALWSSNFKHKNFPRHAPILVSTRKPNDQNQILFIDWYYDIEETNESGWNGMINLINEKGNCWLWEEKIEKLFWRGLPNDSFAYENYRKDNWTKIPRGALVALSMQFPDLIDAAFVKYSMYGCSIKECEHISHFARVADFVPIIEHTQYKYQMIINGVTSTYPGTQWRLYSNCLSFKQESQDLMWFEPELIPYVHYIPVDQYMTNLLEQINWAKNHDNEAKQIAQNAKKFASTHLMPRHILLYCYHILSRYAQLQKFQPKPKIS